MTRTNRQYFGTDGVRGRVGQEPITPETILRLGYAAGRVLAANATKNQSKVSAIETLRVLSNKTGGANKPGVLIAKDTRISGYMLEAALEAGFSAAGVDVVLCGPLPTPAVAYLTHTLRLQAGVVISASHNSFEDNGIKFFSAQGEKLPDEVEHLIEQALEQPMSCVPSHLLGKARRLSDAQGRYIEFCKSTFANALSLKGLKIVVDAAHGAAYQVAPLVFHELGAEVVAIGDQPNGLNINEGVGALFPEVLRAAVQTHRADIGIALDGDGDRLVIVDTAGTVYNGDQLLYVIAAYRRLRGRLQGGVVGTIMSNLAVEQALQALEIPFVRTAVGDRYVLEKMVELGWELGGESSGHIICRDKHSTGDGIVAALQVLAAIQRFNRSLSEWTQSLVLFPQKLLNVPLPKVPNWQETEPIRAICAEVRQTLGDHGRLVLRPSGTEPVVRVMVEARTEVQALEAAQRVAKAIEAL